MPLLPRQGIIWAAVTFLVLLEKAETAKQRKWLGPTNFVEGSPPSTTQGGLASVDENIYIFGGNSNAGIMSFENKYYLNLAI